MRETPTNASCSDKFYRLASLSRSELETVFLRGTPPALESLAGWEFFGMNHPAWAKYVGIKKFIKGFSWRGDDLYGYNCPVVQDGIYQRWNPRPLGQVPKRFGFYRAAPVDPSARDNRYLQAVLLNYGEGGNPRLDPSRGLRDYLVQVEEDALDLYLGKAYYAIGSLRLRSNFFLLERGREASATVAT